ncbi:MAG TPA: hypothetical protein VKA60_11630 [Blastocatellia bacterium]|nr:hypothetical protein [Blastocatellia bacterium]
MKNYHLEFPHRHSYIRHLAITIPIILVSDADNRVAVSAKLDTGSTYCIFERKYADLLELPLTLGIEERISTATGSFYCYGHELTLSMFDLEWQAVVYFAEMEAFSLNVVGRAGFLDRLQIGVVDYDQLLYLGLYDQH